MGSRLHHGRDVDQESHHAGWQTVLLVLRSLEYFLQGNTEQHQLTLIAQLCGAICPEVFHYCPLFSSFFYYHLVQGVARGRTARLVQQDGGSEDSEEASHMYSYDIII